MNSDDILVKRVLDAATLLTEGWHLLDTQELTETLRDAALEIDYLKAKNDHLQAYISHLEKQLGL